MTRKKTFNIKMLYFIDLIDELIWGVREYLTSIKAEINKIMNIDLSKIK